MSYISKQPAKELESVKKVANTATGPTFSDQRSSTTAQLKQQQIMRSSHSPNVIQQLTAEEDEPLQAEFENEAPAQLQEAPAAKPNNTGLPDNLKAGIENLSGYSMDDVKVHFNSDMPAQLNALAYARGTDIHIAPGQEQHLPHEAWHVVQQKQGRVQATMQMKAGMPVNDDASLENEADVMGTKALNPLPNRNLTISRKPTTPAFQLQTKITYQSGYYTYNGKPHVVGSKMYAELDPNDAVKGSEPGNGVQKSLMEDLKKVGTFKSMIRGHLLNDNVGGLGVAMNLFPITSQANSRHKNYVESYVKQAIKDEGTGKNRILLYSVNVDPAPENLTNSPPNVKFNCNVQWSDGAKVISDVITSNPQTGTTGTGSAQNPNAPSKTFKTKDLPANWGKKGYGYKSLDADHKKTYSRTRIEGINIEHLSAEEMGTYFDGEPEIDVVAEQVRTIIEDTYNETDQDYNHFMEVIDEHEANDSITDLMELLSCLSPK